MDINLLEKLYEEFKSSSGISTDTRQIAPNQLFFCLKGPNFDANSFAEKSLEAGARMVISDAEFNRGKAGVFLVDDALAALQALARHHRRQFKIPFLGVTGSNGKTTTKELLREVLSRKFRVWATKGNLNNHIGVPLTLLSMPADTEFAIIEMGANHVGEIAALSAIAEPNFGLITNIGKAHLEGFGGVEGIIRGKSELFDFLLKNDGTVFLNTADPVLANMKWRFPKVYTYPNPGDDVQCTLLKAEPFLCLQTASGKMAVTHLIGAYNFLNAATALAVGTFFGVDESAALEAIAAYEPTNNRSQLIKKGNSLLILDAYNANPSSMEVALRNLGQMSGYTRKIAILGDMLELGDESDREHQKLGELSLELKIDQVLICGPLMKAAKEGNPSANYFENKAELQLFLKTQSFEQSVVLVKGSRGMGLESLKDSININ